MLINCIAYQHGQKLADIPVPELRAQQVAAQRTAGRRKQHIVDRGTQRPADGLLPDGPDGDSGYDATGEEQVVEADPEGPQPDGGLHETACCPFRCSQAPLWWSAMRNGTNNAGSLNKNIACES